MSWTKQQIIIAAYETLGYASYVYDMQPERLVSAMHKLDALMGMLNPKLRLGYPIPTDQTTGNLDDDSNLPDYAIEMVYAMLAVRLAPGIGKQIPPDLKLMAENSFRDIVRRQSVPRDMQYPSGTPVGSGNKPWRTYDNPFVDDPTYPQEVDNDNGAFEELFK